MKHRHITTLLSTSLLLLSCSSDLTDALGVNTTTERGKVLQLNGKANSFSGESALSSVSFINGEVMYLNFASGSAYVKGQAIYNSNSSYNHWTLDDISNIPETAHNSCNIVYIENPESSTSSQVVLGASSTVYEATGSYANTTSALHVSASLSPKTARVHFKGTPGTKIIVTGLKRFTAYNIDSNTYENTPQSSSLELTVDNDGYTPYVYALAEDNRIIRIVVDDVEFSRTFIDSSVLMPAHSGYINIPTEGSYDGWSKSTNATISGTEYGSDSNWDEKIKIDTNTTINGTDYDSDEDWNPSTNDLLSFNVNGVSFNMVKVEAGTFTMGATSEMLDYESDEKPTHQVTLSKDYYIGQTEVTQALWQAVMSSNPSYFKGDNQPVEQVSWDDCQTFISKLNTLTGKTFRLPTEAEWEFAARGGNKSKHTQYSGSANIEDVAWYSDNSSNRTHDVATKQPNELGIYDMSGNVMEWCYDWYDAYSSSAQINPTGPSSGSFRVYRGGGGNWLNYARFCRSSLRRNGTPSSRYYFIGLRLVLVP